MTLEFVDFDPRASGARRGYDWPGIVTDCKAQPGKWAILGPGQTANASLRKAARSVGLEVTFYRGTFYVRWPA